jgi:hypothetical protein
LKRWRLVSIPTVAVALAGLAGSLTAFRARPEDAAAVAAPVRSPLSCKVAAPVHLTLQQGSGPGVWHLQLTAIEDAKDVTVTVGSNRGDIEMTHVVAWHGSLQRGAVQEIDAHLAVAGDATSLWAEARVASPAGVVQRDLAALDVVLGKATARTASAAAGGRVVTDPRSGATVLEFQGEMGGKR